MMFNMYGDVLGMAPEAIPPALFLAFALDSLIAASIVAFRHRKVSASWIPHRREAAYSEAVPE